VVDVRDDYARFQQVGGAVAVVTMGSVEQTATFRSQMALPFLCLADPERRAYHAYGLTRGRLSQIAGPAVWLGGLKAIVRGGAGKPVGDVRQLHGSFVIDRNGIVRYIHRPTNSADRPTNDELIGVIQSTLSRRR
jgi:peroxiredoxin